MSSRRKHVQNSKLILASQVLWCVCFDCGVGGDACMCVVRSFVLVFLQKNHFTPMIHNVPAGGPKVVMGVTLQPIKVMVKV